MNPDKDHIKKNFASKLKSFEQEPPAFMWEKIESGLDTQQIHKPKTHRLIYKIAGWTTAAAAAIVIGLFLFLPDQDVQHPIAVVEPLISHIDTDTVMIAGENLPQDKDSLLRQSSSPMPQISKAVLLADLKANRVGKRSDFEPIKNSKAESLLLTNDTDDSLTVSKTYDDTEVLAATPIPDKQKKATESLQKDVQKQIEEFEAEGHRAENLLAENIKSEPDKLSKSSLALGVNGGGAFSKADGYKRTVVAMANADQQFSLRSETVKLEHNQPITFGLSINKRINDRFSLESGITYAYLSSKIRSSSASAYSKNNTQYFHYLGIPLTINYNVAEWNKIRFYISAGGAIQKDIYGRLDRSSGVTLSGSSKSGKKNISQKNVQMSLSSSVGISYPIYGQMSLYTTVGGAYYIDAKNEYETIFSDKKWLLNLNLGIKFGF